MLYVLGLFVTCGNCFSAGDYSVTVTAKNPLGTMSTTLTPVLAVQRAVSDLNVKILDAVKNKGNSVRYNTTSTYQAALGSGTNVRFQWDMGDSQPMLEGELFGTSLDHLHLQWQHVHIFTINILFNLYTTTLLQLRVFTWN